MHYQNNLPMTSVESNLPLVVAWLWNYKQRFGVEINSIQFVYIVIIRNQIHIYICLNNKEDNVINVSTMFFFDSYYAICKKEKLKTSFL